MARPCTVYSTEDLMAKTVEVGDCIEWQGYFCKKDKSPLIYHNGKMTNVRKLLAVLSGRDVKKLVYWSACCGNWRCVNPHPDHTVARTRAKHIAYMQSLVDLTSNVRRQNLREAAKARGLSKVDEHIAAIIRDDPRECAVIAPEYGIGPEQVSRIKRGVAWGALSAAVNPWVTLIR